ncbi:MAG: J domain-containing protein [Spirochaetales bacterium]|nr:J domain-containing protein [Spirochaetales bacterium]
MSNYYIVLGVDKDADLGKIKHAYRLYCKKFHPDLASDEQKNNFLKIQEAYETLSDKEKRRIYDQSLNKPHNQIPVNFMNNSFWEGKKNRNRLIEKFSGLLDDFFEGFVSGFFDDDFSGNKELYLELILSPDEARNGGDFPIEVPVVEECIACSGRGYIDRFICSTCSGLGNLHNKRSFSLHVPPHVTSGLTAKVSLEGIGLRDVFLNIEVIV